MTRGGLFSAPTAAVGAAHPVCLLAELRAAGADVRLGDDGRVVASRVPAALEARLARLERAGGPVAELLRDEARIASQALEWADLVGQPALSAADGGEVGLVARVSHRGVTVETPSGAMIIVDPAKIVRSAADGLRERCNLRVGAQVFSGAREHGNIAEEDIACKKQTS